VHIDKREGMVASGPWGSGNYYFQENGRKRRGEGLKFVLASKTQQKYTSNGLLYLYSSFFLFFISFGGFPKIYSLYFLFLKSISMLSGGYLFS
jgi:hypothetical protein